jgi:hypothetical protein
VAKSYIGVHPTIRSAGAVWVVDEKSVFLADGSKVGEVVPGADPLECVKSTHPDWTFQELKLAPGEYYPRMARTTSDDLNASPGVNPANLYNKILIETGRGQLVALREQLERIFRTVHPIEKNFDTYGHDIRNLLILAATEVEAHWKGILKANGVEGGSTKDYVKLLDAMKLDEYAVKLPFYPWLAAIKPFYGWSSAAPTQSLTWYDAYNAVKHDRETLFERGTLFHAIEAVCGCAVITFAQFGRSGFHDSRQLMTLLSFDRSAEVGFDGSICNFPRSFCCVQADAVPLLNIHVSKSP